MVDMKRLRIPLLIWLGWLIFLLLLTTFYILNPAIKDFFNLVLMYFMVVIMFLQAQILKYQTKLLANPIIDANARIKEDGKVQIQIANVGNYTAKDLKIVVEIDTPSTLYRYICEIFPSLPPESMYTSGVNRSYFEIMPLFWIPESKNSKTPGNILELMDYLCIIGYSKEIVKITLYLQASNHETVKLFMGTTTPHDFRKYVAGIISDIWILKARSKNPIKILWDFLRDKIHTYQEKRRKKIEEFNETMQLNISKLTS